MSPSQPNSHPSRRRARSALLFVGALLFLFEEWLWIGFTRLFARLGRLGLFRWLDGRLARLSPIAALVILCIPIALLFPFKVAGLWMIASGRFFTGCCVMLAAKIASTAIIARIFLTCRPQLLRMPWFARLYNVVYTLRGRIHLWLADQPAWRDARRFMAGVRRSVGAWVGRRPHPARAATGFVVRNGVLRRWRRARRKTAMASGSPHARTHDDDRS
jgi:hypothetical protein